MSWLKIFATSNIGLKFVMAASGLVLFGFVVIHMLGNLQVYLGPEVYNHYAETLQGSPEIVWGARLGLLAMVLAHIASATTLVIRSKKARPEGYKEHTWLSGNYAVRTMRWGGLILALFIVYHLLHFTVGLEAVHPDFVHCEWEEAGDITCGSYQNFIIGFQNPLVVIFYILAQAALGLHLAHGVWSMLRTLGLSNPRYVTIARGGAIAFGTIVALGNISMPIAAIAGLLPQTDEILQESTASR